MQADLIVKNIGVLLTPLSGKTPLRGKALDEVLEINNAFIAVKDEKIIDFGNHEYNDYIGNDTQFIDAENNLVTPGLIDSHTHVVHGGSREFEFEQKMRGVPYLDILKAGGGIHSTVKSTQSISDDALFKQAHKSLDFMLGYGVTTVEGKSGYGLALETEVKQLTVSNKLNKAHPIDIIPTFMGAHALPLEYKNDRMAFIDKVIDMLPEIKKQNLAEFVDIFCEDGAFNVEESKKMLTAALAHGFGVKIHADEVVALGGVKLACELNAVSADHLMAINEEGLNALSKSNTIANILPSTSFYLNSTYAPVRTMIDRNVAIALSSDYNPGSSPSENFLFTLNLAAIHLKMSPNEILNAATVNAAHSVKRAHKVGLIAKGYKADLVIYDAPNWPYVLYHYATNHVKHVIKNGKHVIKNKQNNWE